jgi:hypothetical protein
MEITLKNRNGNKKGEGSSLHHLPDNPAFITILFL